MWAVVGATRLLPLKIAKQDEIGGWGSCFRVCSAVRRIVATGTHPIKYLHNICQEDVRLQWHSLFVDEKPPSACCATVRTHSYVPTRLSLRRLLREEP